MVWLGCDVAGSSPVVLLVVVELRTIVTGCDSAPSEAASRGMGGRDEEELDDEAAGPAWDVSPALEGPALASSRLLDILGSTVDQIVETSVQLGEGRGGETRFKMERGRRMVSRSWSSGSI